MINLKFNPLKYFKADKSFYRTLLTLAIPIFLQSIITQGVQMADTIMLGKLGEIALSGSSLANSFISIYSIFCMGLGQGAAVVTSQYWGKRELGPIRSMTAILIKIAIGLSLIFTVGGYFFAEPILHIYSSEEEVIKAGAEYLRIIALGSVFMGLTTAITSIFRSIGHVKITLFTSIGSFFINVFFNYCLIFGHFGFPRLEMRGAAYATVMARIFEFVCIYGYFFFKDDRVAFRFRHLKGFDKDLFGRYVKVGLPVLISDGIMSLGNNLVSIVIGHLGKAFLAANSIVAVVNHAVSIASSAMSASSSVIIGNTIGAEGTEKAYDQGKTFIALSTAIGLFGGFLLFALKGFFIGMYDLEAETVVCANQMLDIAAALLVFQCLDSLLTKGVLRGGGDTKFLVIADTIFTWTASAPLGYLAGFVFNWPVWAVFLCLRADYILKAILVIWRFLSKRWVRDVTTSDFVKKKA